MTTSVEPEVFDDRVCGLGESPLWHPLRNELFWVDLPNNSLLSKGEHGSNAWVFDEMASAVAWIDRDTLLLAMESGLFAFDLRTEEKTLLCTIEENRPGNRSNDGRADPWGGFWVGTMGKSAETGQGAVYRWYRGELRMIASELSIPNGICFDRQRNLAYYADSPRHLVFSQSVDADTGWPVGDPGVFLDLSDSAPEPDGAVIDTSGCMWSAQWSASRIVCYSPEGRVLKALDATTPRPACPGFGGKDSADLYVTTAAIGLDGTEAYGVDHGTTVVFSDVAEGVSEPPVVIDYQEST